MHIGLVLLALVLLWLTISALLTGRPAAALLSLSALVSATWMLWDQHRRRVLVGCRAGAAWHSFLESSLLAHG